MNSDDEDVEKVQQEGGDEEKEGDDKKKKRVYIPIKNASDYQRMKLARLLANPDKPVNIPERPKERNLPPPPDFVRNIMGSSAGAGSGEFHVYRHLRRKEYARQKCIQEQARREEKDAEFQRKRDENLRKAEDKTAKKRAKRLKRKQMAKLKAGKKSKNGNKVESDSSSEAESDSNSNGDHSASAGTNEDSSSNHPNPNTNSGTLEGPKPELVGP